MSSPASLPRQRMEVMQQAELRVTGMHCGGCASRVKEALSALPSVSEVLVSHLKGSAFFNYDPGQLSLEQASAAVTAAGFSAEPVAA
jgi:copper chaperone CopZ